MKKRNDEYSMREAATKLGIDQRTCAVWAKDALTGGGRFQVGSVRRDLVGRYFVSRDEVRRVLESHLSVPSHTADTSETANTVDTVNTSKT